MELSSRTKQKIELAKQALRPYQRQVFQRMVEEKRHLNYMEMGMGKGLVTLLSVMELQAFPCMIVCSKSAMFVLEQELKEWFDEPCTLYLGKPAQRDRAFSDFAQNGHRFIITNYSLAGELGAKFGIVTPDLARRGSSTSGTSRTSSTPPPTGTRWKVGALVADEIQRGGLFNHKTKTYKIFKQLAKAIPVVYLLTGTPYRRGAIDLFAPLSLIDPRRYDSYWKFVNKYCITIDTGFGKSIERNPRDVVAFREMVRRYASILKKADHLKELPKKIRQTVLIEMNPEQERIYRELEEELFAETGTGELIITPGKLSLQVRFRQLLACPQVLGLKGRGAAIDNMIEMASDLVGENKPFVIFTPFKQAVPIISAALREEFGSIPIYEITGGLTAAEFGDKWKSFQAGKGTAVLICVIKSGASFHATRADTAFFIGYEYDFNENEQAEDRLHRMGQKNTVQCFYFLHKGTTEEEVRRILNDKKYGAELVLSSEEVFKRMLAKRER